MNRICLLLLAIFFLCCNISFAQVTNVKQGLWGDASVWSNNAVPTATTDVLLNYDVTVNINASCKSLAANGHSVTVETGFTLNITGVSVKASDTATLLHIINTYYNNDGTTYDSSIITIKNNYINSHKRITEEFVDIYTDSSSSSLIRDTSYADYKYNTQNQLESVLFYDTNIADGSDLDSIVWQNNRVASISYYYQPGIIQSSETFSYAPSGSNTNITVDYFPNRNQDTTYTDSTNTTISYFDDTKSFITVNNSFVPISQTYFTRDYFANYEPLDTTITNYYDTANYVYTYANGNLFSNIAYGSGTDTNAAHSPVSIDHFKDTISYTYYRHLSENPAVNQLLKNVYGDTLLTLMNFFETELSTYDLLGEPSDISVDYDYDVQTVDSAIYKEADWLNGTSNGTISYTSYRSVNKLDAQNRLVESAQYGQYSGTKQRTIRFIYP